jgi:hypothetical protein
MILDAQLQFSDAQAITADAASTNIVDMGVAARDIGTGESLYIVVNVDVAFTDSGSDSTLAVILEGDSTATLTPDASLTLFTIPALAAVGDQFIARLDPSAAVLQYQYLGLQYTPANGNLTTGSVTAHMTNSIDAYVYHADAITIS